MDQHRALAGVQDRPLGRERRRRERLARQQALPQFVAQPEKAMFPFKVGLTSVNDVDRELLSWLKKAFDAAG